MRSERGARVGVAHHQESPRRFRSAVVLPVDRLGGIWRSSSNWPHRDETNANELRKLNAPIAQTIASLSEARDTTDNWLSNFSGFVAVLSGHATPCVVS